MAEKRQRRRLVSAAFVLAPKRKERAASWNVVAERGKNHIVDGLGADAHGRCGRRGFGNAIARPGVLGDVGVLHSELKAALRTLVELVPEAERAFLDEADVAGTVGPTRGPVQV